MLTLILQATTTVTDTSSSINLYFGLTALLFHKNGNMAFPSTGGTTEEFCGYGNTDCD
jgi:predicted glycosyltransferase involved in capsule biosynthesis